MTFDELLKEYFDTFGQNYPLMITSDVEEDEIIRDIIACIENGEPAKPTEYEEGLIY